MYGRAVLSNTVINHDAHAFELSGCPGTGSDHLLSALFFVENASGSLTYEFDLS